jgi:hypothetical protein
MRTPARLLLLVGIVAWALAFGSVGAVDYEYNRGSYRFLNAGGGSDWLCLGQGSWLAGWPTSVTDQITWSVGDTAWHNTALNPLIAGRYPQISLSFESHAPTGGSFNRSWECQNQNYTLINTARGEFVLYPSGLYGSFMSISDSDFGDDEWYHVYHEQGLRSFPTAWTVTGTIND